MVKHFVILTEDVSLNFGNNIIKKDNYKPRT